VQHIRHFAVLVCIAVCCAASTTQELPTIASVTELSKNARKFDGHLVQVRAWLAFGWEGDNFLFDSAKPAPHNTADFRAPSVWFYCKPDDYRDRTPLRTLGDLERKGCDTIKIDVSPILGTFTGYFHFVTDQKTRMKDVFDPGPFQLEVIGVSGLVPSPKPKS